MIRKKCRHQLLPELVKTEHWIWQSGRPSDSEFKVAGAATENAERP